MSERGRRRAVAYYRVSTTRQAQTGTSAEEHGDSIAAQQAACHRYAAEHGLEIVAEYPEPGGSGTAIDRRPMFRELLERVLHRQDVEAVLVYARSRAFRNAFEAMVTREEFRKLGVELLSTQEPSEVGPEGDLVTLILDGVNEYQSRKLGADVSFKMGAKAARGGTPGRAKLGYRNVRERIDGRVTATIEVDPDRAPFIETAFRLFAAGQYSLNRLRDALTEAGLRTRPTQARPAGTAVSLSQLSSLLRDRTYLGYVLWCGQEHPGRHPALVEVDLFDRVQRVLAERRRGTRDRKWDHFLKGLLWCGRCRRRMIFECSRSHSGRLYFYYRCAGLQHRSCDLPRIPIAAVEDAAEAYFAALNIDPTERAAISQLVAGALADHRTAGATLRKRLESELTRLDRLEDQCLELLGSPGWPTEKLTERLQHLNVERDKVKQRLAAAQDRTSDDQLFRKRIDKLLGLFAEPRELCKQLSEDLRKTFATVCFDKLAIDAADRAPYQPVETWQVRARGSRREQLDLHALADLLVVAAEASPWEPSDNRGRCRSGRDLTGTVCKLKC
ncbi:recombinase family protein [Glycomyces halotolerans]